MAADRRTLVIAVVAMLGLVALGVVSGALFARSACATISPEAVAAAEVSTGADVEAGQAGAAAAAALGDLTPADRAAVEEGVGALADRLGAVTAVTPVNGVDRIAAIDGGVAALGPVVTTFVDGGTTAGGAVSLQQGVAVGDGAHLYSLALTNPLTGQVDALQPLDEDLSGMTCVDTALVGSPLAFHLAAGDGELLLLRIEEDGDDAELELRDPVAGRRVAAELELPTAPAGLAGARLTGGLGPDLVVAATRTTGDDEVPVITAVERSDGSPRWTLDRAALGAAGVTLPAGPVRAEVAAVGPERVLVGLREVDGAGRADEEAEQDASAQGEHVLVLLHAADGEVLADGRLEPGERVTAAAVDLDRAEVVVADVEGVSLRLLRLSPDGLEVSLAGDLGGVAPALLADDEGVLRAVGGGPAGVVNDALDTAGVEVVVAALGGVVAVMDGRDEVVVSVPAIDVVRHDGGVSLLLAGDDGARALVTFGG